MPKIVIYNNLTEQMSGIKALELSDEFAIKSAFRNVWLLEENDLVISPVSISEEFKSYLGRFLDFNIQSVTFVYPTSYKSTTVSDEMLMLDEIIEQVNYKINHDCNWVIYPCYYSSGVAKLARILNLKVDKTNSFFEEKGADIFNRKILFRQLASGTGIPIPKGSITYSHQQLSNAIKDHIDSTGVIIIKQDSGAGGMGNIAYTKTACGLLPGVKETRVLSDDIPREALNIWNELEDTLSAGIIVEEYHRSNENFYLEFIVHEDQTISFSHSGSIIVEKNSDDTALEWTGLTIPAQVSSSVHSRAHTFAQSFIHKAVAIGHKGYINIDMIYTKQNEIFVNEVNGRWGGGTVLDAVAEKLLGPYYYDEYYIGSVRNLDCLSFPEIIKNFSEHNRHFDPAKKEGIVIISTDNVYTKSMECLILAKNKDTFIKHKTWLKKNYGRK
jgi:hypothetical protein